jgi:hypothetical protein
VAGVIDGGQDRRIETITLWPKEQRIASGELDRFERASCSGGKSKYSGLTQGVEALAQTLMRSDMRELAIVKACSA